MSIDIRAEDIKVEVSLGNGNVDVVKEIRLTALLKLLIAEVADSPTFLQNLSKELQE